MKSKKVWASLSVLHVILCYALIRTGQNGASGLWMLYFALWEGLLIADAFLSRGIAVIMLMSAGVGMLLCIDNPGYGMGELMAVCVILMLGAGTALIRHRRIGRRKAA